MAAANKKTRSADQQKDRIRNKKHHGRNCRRAKLRKAQADAAMPVYLKYHTSKAARTAVNKTFENLEKIDFAKIIDENTLARFSKIIAESLLPDEEFSHDRPISTEEALASTKSPA